jgi:hypothetical protein
LLLLPFSWQTIQVVATHKLLLYAAHHPEPCQVMFGTNKTIAAQDPSYPVYVDTTVMLGNTGTHNGTGFDGIEYMVCTPENNFFPDLSKVRPGVIFSSHYIRLVATLLD